MILVLALTLALGVPPALALAPARFYQSDGGLLFRLGPTVARLSRAPSTTLRSPPRPGGALILAGLAAFCCTNSIFVNHITQEATWYFGVSWSTSSWPFQKRQRWG